MNTSHAGHTLPMVDAASLRNPAGPARAAAVATIAAAGRKQGFFYVSNHGIDPSLQSEVFRQMSDFFTRPLPEKLAVDKALSSCNRGYEKLGGQTLEAGSPPDLKEGYYLGEELLDSDPRAAVKRFNQGPNQWPSEMPEFRRAMNTYHSAMMQFSEVLMGGVAEAMDLPPTELDAYLSGSIGILRLLHYPPQPPNPRPNEKGCGAHTDFGGLTVLLQDDSGGLQVLDPDTSEWLEAPPLPGTYVVNLGDLITRWTNGGFRSSVHRVINRSGHDRHSVPFFFSGNPDYVVRCLPWALDRPGAAPPEPITVEQHLADCYSRTYA